MASLNSGWVGAWVLSSAAGMQYQQNSTTEIHFSNVQFTGLNFESVIIAQNDNIDEGMAKKLNTYRQDSSVHFSYHTVCCAQENQALHVR